MRAWTHRLAASLLLVLAFAAAAADTVEDLERRVRELEREVAQLRKADAADPDRLAELERQIQILTEEIERLKLGEAAPAAEQSRHGLGPAASKVYAVREGVSIGGYGEALYENFAPQREDDAPSGRTDQVDFLRLVLYAGYKFHDRLVFNSEIEFEHATTGSGDDSKGEVSVEFAYLDFLLRDAVNLRAGMVLVPMGFLNELHEPPVFLGARRPQVEQRLIPTTWRENGVGVFGDLGPLSYRAYLVAALDALPGTSSDAAGFTAAGIRGGRASGSRSPARDVALTGRLDWTPVRGLTLGSSFWTGDTGQGAFTPGGAEIEARTTLADVHADWRWRGLQARALYVRTTIDDVELINEARGFTGDASVGERQFGWYGELGYDVLAGRGTGTAALIPFARHERFDTQHRVPAGFAASPANDVEITTVGLVYKPILNVAVKADWNSISNEARTGVDQVNLALGFLF